MARSGRSFKKSRRQSSRTPVFVRGNHYESQSGGIRARCKSSAHPADPPRDREEPLSLAAKDGRPPKPVRIGGRAYASRTEAARVLGVGIDSGVRWSKRGGANRPLRLIIMDLETFEQSARPSPCGVCWPRPDGRNPAAPRYRRQALTEIGEDGVARSLTLASAGVTVP